MSQRDYIWNVNSHVFEDYFESKKGQPLKWIFQNIPLRFWAVTCLICVFLHTWYSMKNVQHNAAANSIQMWATHNYRAEHCNKTMSDGRVSTYWLITVHASPDVRVSCSHTCTILLSSQATKTHTNGHLLELPQLSESAFVCSCVRIWCACV